MKVIQAIRRNDTSTIRNLLRIGLSPNPCNKFGESVVHMICRCGYVDMLEVFLEFGCNLQVCDDFGRTPLHDVSCLIILLLLLLMILWMVDNSVHSPYMLTPNNSTHSFVCKPFS